MSATDHDQDRQTVPDELTGCWRRAWIEYADGTRDDTSFVIWMQLASAMADIRIRADRPTVAYRDGLAACSLDELRALADSESSSGFTRCTPIAVDDDGVRRATAEWFTRGHGVNFQPVSAFPEPGLLEWMSDEVLIERAPSGAYVEEWRLLPNTRHTFEHHTAFEGRQLYRTGDAVVVVRDRPTPVRRAARLEELVAECGDDRDALAALVDCEFSFARRDGDEFRIEASTLPWREGQVVDVDLR
jgi:hypothetical protein